MDDNLQSYQVQIDENNISRKSGLASVMLLFSFFIVTKVEPQKGCNCLVVFKGKARAQKSLMALMWRKG